jgi:ABC-type Zn uptake system ZnuABC Zn-binding protein ZnuA
MQDLIELIKMHNAKAVFAEVGLNPALTQTVARESGAKVIDNLYVDTLSDPGGPAPTYLDMMTYNTALIVNALK